MILTFHTFIKAENIVNVKHQLKWKLAWPFFAKSMKLNKNGVGTMTAAVGL